MSYFSLGLNRGTRPSAPPPLRVQCLGALNDSLRIAYGVSQLSFIAIEALSYTINRQEPYLWWVGGIGIKNLIVTTKVFKVLNI